MGFLIRLLRVTYVCLTAVMVLIAGSPYITCRCPDGHRKLFCFSSPTQSGGCCCNGSCCSTSAGEKPSCCCQAHKERDNVPSGTHCRVESSGCSKTLTPPTLVAVNNSHEAHLDGALASPFNTTPSPALAPPLPKAAHGPLAWQNYHLPPPPNLIVALQHFII